MNTKDTILKIAVPIIAVIIAFSTGIILNVVL